LQLLYADLLQILNRVESNVVITVMSDLALGGPAQVQCLVNVAV